MITQLYSRDDYKFVSTAGIVDIQNKEKIRYVALKIRYVALKHQPEKLVQKI